MYPLELLYRRTSLSGHVENTAIVFSPHSNRNWRPVGQYCAILEIIKLNCDVSGTKDWSTHCHADLISSPPIGPSRKQKNEPLNRQHASEAWRSRWNHDLTSPKLSRAQSPRLLSSLSNFSFIIISHYFPSSPSFVPDPNSSFLFDCLDGERTEPSSEPPTLSAMSGPVFLLALAKN